MNEQTAHPAVKAVGAVNAREGSSPVTTQESPRAGATARSRGGVHTEQRHIELSDGVPPRRSLLIRNGIVLTMDNKNRVLDPGWVFIEGDRISMLGTEKPVPRIAGRAHRTIDASGMIVMPGLINCHDHLCQTFMTGTPDGLRLFEWLDSVVVPLQKAMSPEDVHNATLLGLIQNLRAGVTTVIEHLKHTQTQQHSDAAARAAALTGQRVLLAWGWQDSPDLYPSPARLWDHFTQFLEKWHSHGMLSVAMGPLNTWNCSEEVLRRTREFPYKNIPVHIHASETEDEVARCVRRRGLTPIRWLDRLGILRPETHLVHCVAIDDSEIALISERRANVVHCPISNLYLASGNAPLVKLINGGINVAFGTDGMASGLTHDLLSVARLAALLAKVSNGDPSVTTASPILHMVTGSGARLLGRDDIGKLVPGAKADVTLFGIRGSHIASGGPYPEADLLYQATGFEAHTVIVDGRVLLDAGKVSFLDESEFLPRCGNRMKALNRRARVAMEVRRKQNQLLWPEYTHP